MFRIKEKRERALGIKLSIKGARSNSPKAALLHESAFFRETMARASKRAGSEYNAQLKEKQKVRFSYGLDRPTAYQFYSESLISACEYDQYSSRGAGEHCLDNARSPPRFCREPTGYAQDQTVESRTYNGQLEPARLPYLRLRKVGQQIRGARRMKDAPLSPGNGRAFEELYSAYLA